MYKVLTIQRLEKLGTRRSKREEKRRISTPSITHSSAIYRVRQVDIYGPQK